MIAKLKDILGEKRLAKLAKTPAVVDNPGGLEAHLQAACKDVAHVGVALSNALSWAGLKPNEKEVEAFLNAKAEYDKTKVAPAMEVATAVAEDAPPKVSGKAAKADAVAAK